MGSLRLDVASNFVAQAWGALLALLLVPAWLALLGAEGFGLVGLFLALQAMLPALDLGLGAAFNRAAATHGEDAASRTSLRDTARTLELLFVAGAVLLAGLAWMLAGSAATRWLSPRELDALAVSRALLLMGLAIAVQWPSTLYLAGFRGLRRQARLNAALIVLQGLRHLGALGALLLLGASIEVFAAWQVAVSALQVLWLRHDFWRIAPEGAAPRARWGSMRPLWRFAAGAAATAALGAVLMQADRLVLAARSPLADVGVYMLAATLASGLAIVAQPAFHALFPRYSRLAAHGERDELASLHHRAAQWLAISIWSLVTALVWAPRHVLWAWTGDAQAAQQATTALALLAPAAGLNATLVLPYALQLAHGWTRLALGFNAAGLVLLLPAAWWAAGRWGGAGVGGAWLALNLAMFAILPVLLHRRVLRGELARWYVADTLLPAGAALLAGGAMHLMGVTAASRTASLLWAAALASIAFASALLASPGARTQLLQAASRPSA